MEKSQLVSVVMCVYNGERFIRKQIESILAQTYKDLELLILDDCSTDSSVKIINSYLDGDKRIKLIQNQQNIGFNKNFEKGFQLCIGDLIAVSDQDDIWLPEKIGRLVESLADNLLIYSNSSKIDEHGTMLQSNLNTTIHHVDLPGFKSFLDDNFITGHTCLFKKELLNYVLPFPENLFFYDWWLGFVASYVGRVKYLDEILTKYRVHSQSAYQKLTKQQKKNKTWAILKKKQTEAFADAPFLKPHDADFINKFLKKTNEAHLSAFNKVDCYFFLLRNEEEIYPWYKKPILKKLNFLRKKCVR
ncbi:MAG: glycosyltransferase family 2 protein [Flavobacterium sp.]|nr:glycosyltransferase family 2 protein [Pedobacter sp.]